ncbi:non-oxidative hydroxyarylic acid decarboxylases subunit C [Telmatospirillum sp.]|uniref:non-oxidative hydroxyarylic acid decarboxylases subunit C n=1 Tax=Telmatospirillum sp. TaxID=2079197 RepID=UPI00284D8A7E|nr:non-oxidative hydroxyarylic acid decarboxylases subunit C [Telmatospirillum sp.]MDR3437372.1 non-oxidative hydroxyarylic acid decarboxylases subunit C [Telmatospirillum sp.]
MAVYQDFREFLSKLEEEKQLLRIKEEVWPEPDLGAAGRAISNLGEQTPALLFENIAGYRDARIAMNVHGSWPNLAIALGMPKDTPLREQFHEFVRRYQTFPGEVEQRTSAPWQDQVIEKDINLFEIMPLFRLNRGDGGFYIDKACLVSRDPDDPLNDDVQNVGMYRLQVKGPNRIAIQPVPEHDVAVHLAHAEERNEDLPVVITLGNEPIIELVAAMPILYDQSEYRMAAAIQESPYPVIRTQKGLDVPWGAEFVLEGRILSRVREAEGPFGEFTGHYSGGRAMPVIEIDRVSHRTKPIFEHLYLGMPWTEVDFMVGVNTSAPLYVQLKRDFPEVVAVSALYTHGLVVIVSTKRRYGGFAKAVGMRVLSTPHGLGYAKVVIVVDETIDPFNLNQVMWAISTKFNPAGDLMVLPHLSIMPLDPGANPEGMSHKMVIDATTPVPPDKRGHYGQPLDSPQKADVWKVKLDSMIKELTA